MKKALLKVIAMVLVICAMQFCLVPAVSAASTSVTYDFYSRYSSYDYFYHWRTVDDDDYFDSATELTAGTKVARADIAADYGNRLIDWKIEYGSGYGQMATGKTGLFSSTGWVDLNLGNGADVVFRFRSPETANYKVVLNYVANESTTANIATEVKIVPAVKDSYSSAELSALLSQYVGQATFSCYAEISGWGANCKKSSITISDSYPFLEDQDYFLVVNGGSTGGHTLLQSLTVTYAGEYVEPVEEEFPRPVTILEEALPKWDDGFCIATEVNGEDYLAVPINGGKMYIFNLDTWQLVDTVNTGIGSPRGITVDDNGVIYLAGAAYYIYQYDLKTNKSSKSPDANISGVAFGSLYDIHYGGGYLYTGTDMGHIIRYDPNATTDAIRVIHPADYGITNATYVSSVIQQGDYIYAAVTTNAKTHHLVKLHVDAFEQDTVEVIDTVEYTSTKPSTYMSYMSITEDGLILGNATNLMAVNTNVADTNEMALVTADELGSAALPQCYVSEAINGKHYFVSSTDRYLYCYDPQAADGEKVTKTKTNVGQFFDCQGKAVTFDRDGNGEDEKYLIALENCKTSEVVFVNPEGGAFKKLLPLPEIAGAGDSVNSLTNGVAGSNELYYGGFLSNRLGIYNTSTGTYTTVASTTDGIQTDAICVYNGNIYAGNYTAGQLTRINRETNVPEVLFTLNNNKTLFDQARIHSIVAGKVGNKDMIFLGTFPDMYHHGGVIAWHDLTGTQITNADTTVTEHYTYVAIGPNATDVYCGVTARTLANGKFESVAADNVAWYQYTDGIETADKSTLTPVTNIAGGNPGVVADADIPGVVTNQGIKDVAYHNGILYVATSITGGTNATSLDDISAVIIAYDVATKQEIARFDPTTQGFASPVPTISGIEVDGNGNLWCIVSETLFTLTLNDDNSFTYTEKLSFDKYGYDLTQNRPNSSIVFDGNGYVYAAFERIGGLCKINMENPSDHTKLLPYVTTNGQVPESFALGEDGNLYFLLGSSLKMLALESSDEAVRETEWEAANAVTALIEGITEETTSASIKEIRDAYNALSLREQSLVQNYSTLVQAEADALIADIDKLGEITWEKKEQVESLLAIYQAMPLSQQNLVTNYYVLATANKRLLQIESEFPVVVINTAGEKTYYQILADAVAAATEGTIQLCADTVADIVNVSANAVLDLNGFTLTVNTISGKVMDSQDGKGLIKVGVKNAQLTSNENQLILWDSAADDSGYRLFTYTFTNMGEDKNANKSDAETSKEVGTTVKSYWSDLTFTNPYAYALIASANTPEDVRLQLGFVVTWTPDGGAMTEKTFMFADDAVVSWALAEESNDGLQNFCFFIELRGFDELPCDGVVTVMPIAKTAFKTLETDPTTYNHDYVEPGELSYEIGFGIVP